MAKNKKNDMATAILEALKDGTAPWIKPWTPDNSAVPHNPVTGTRYKGANNIYLSMQNVDDPRWVTFKQAANKGWKVKRGSKGTNIQFWQFDKDKTTVNDEGKTVTKKVRLERPILRHYYVFNASQIDGIPPMEPSKQEEWERHDRAENLLKESGAEIQHSSLKPAAYHPGKDTITLPKKVQFDSHDKYYATALHELGHWTGHETRLNRDIKNPFGSGDYAREELRAEISSYMLGMELGIGHDPGQHVAYIDSWIKNLEDHPTEIFRACADAEKIQSFILQFEQERDNNITSENIKDETKGKRGKKMLNTSPEIQPSRSNHFLSFIADLEPKSDNNIEIHPQSIKSKSIGVVRFDKPLMMKHNDRTDTDLARAIDKGNDGIIYIDSNGQVKLVSATNKDQIHKGIFQAAKGLDKKYLAVPFTDKNKAKELGALWHKKAQSWYIPDGLDSAPFAKWQHSQSRTADNPQQQFADFIRDIGGDLHGKMPVMDGKIYRIPEAEGKKGNKDIAYAGYTDGIPAGWVKNWRGEQKNWRAEGVTLTDKDREKLKKDSTEKQARREKKRKKLFGKTARESETFTHDLPRATGKEKYFTDKNLNLATTGAKTDKKGNIVLPMKDIDGNQWSHLTLHPNGFKQILKDSRVQGTFALVGAKNLDEIKGDLNLAEGYSTAAMIHEATGEPVLIAGTGNNLKHVAKALRDKYPERNIFILADDDRYLVDQGKMNTGRVQGQEAAKLVAGHVIFPDFTTTKASKERTDFRDMAKMQGKQAVADYIAVQKDIALTRQKKAQQKEQDTERKPQPALER